MTLQLSDLVGMGGETSSYRTMLSQVTPCPRLCDSYGNSCGAWHIISDDPFGTTVERKL